MAPTIRVHRFLECSHANGPGRRAVLWLQGCTLGCPKCFNPETHDQLGGELMDVDELAGRLASLATVIDGLTISGGEPLQQRLALSRLLRRVRERTGLSIVLFSGFTWEEIQQMGDHAFVLEHVDVLIAGRYEGAKRLARELVGSANKTTHFLTDRYGPADFKDLPVAEVIIDSDGNVVLSGIDPVRW